MTQTVQDRHAENVERIARLEEQVRTLQEAQKETKLSIQNVESMIKPLSDAFQQAKGFRGAVTLLVSIALLGIGAGSTELVKWLFQTLKP